jgi:hypothetical protein
LMIIQRCEFGSTALKERASIDAFAKVGIYARERR